MAVDDSSQRRSALTSLDTSEVTPGQVDAPSTAVCRECGRVHVMGCDRCGADLDVREHYDDCPSICQQPQPSSPPGNHP